MSHTRQSPGGGSWFGLAHHSHVYSSCVCSLDDRLARIFFFRAIGSAANFSASDIDVALLATVLGILVLLAWTPTLLRELLLRVVAHELRELVHESIGSDRDVAALSAGEAGDRRRMIRGRTQGLRVATACGRGGVPFFETRRSG
jgi:hypothetical protein